MLHDTDLRTLSLTDVAERCREESERFFRYVLYDPRFCYEMFRRAIVERVEYAWTLLYNQYHPLVTNWVERNPGFAAIDEEAGYFANVAFHKMWSALTPDKFHKFPDLKSLLRYLQMCVQSVVVDHVRAKEHHVIAQRASGAAPDHDDEKAGDAGVEGPILQELTGQEFWDHIQQRLNGEKEVRVIYYRFILDLKPREICARFPDEFPNVKEIYLTLQNIMARLRRDPNLKKFFNADA